MRPSQQQQTRLSVLRLLKFSSVRWRNVFRIYPVHEWGDNLTLIALVYALEISAKLFQLTTTTPDDARPAVASDTESLRNQPEVNFIKVKSWLQ